MKSDSRIKAIIIDDEDLAREGLNLMISEVSDIEIVAMCSNGVDAVKTINSLKPDVIFLDIKMPIVNGFDVLELLGKEAPAVIFVTAYDEFAVKAFEANALDYLLKPVNPERLRKSIEKLKKHFKTDSSAIENVISVHKKEQTNIERILVRDGSTVHVIPVEDILWLESQDDYVAIKTEKSVFLKLERLGKFEEQLNKQKFKRIHRSYIINLNCLQRIENHRFAILKNGAKLPVSRSGYSRLFETNE
ncbi:MAG: response regulator [Calditrichaeota bacterium]|nr:MAG: response regulator [Calditrichota bacterium]MBL1205542.1 response regulator [Calditrichota bacterium]NOG45371.1 response regulator [Calditrichota bacterium]